MYQGSSVGKVTRLRVEHGSFAAEGRDFDWIRTGSEFHGAFYSMGKRCPTTADKVAGE